MGKRTDRDPTTGKRILRFVATSAVVVAPVSLAACGGATGAPEASNVDHHEETTNVGPEEEAPVTTNVDHTAEPHTNVGPEDEGQGADEGEEAGGGDEESPE